MPFGSDRSTLPAAPYLGNGFTPPDSLFLFINRDFPESLSGQIDLHPAGKLPALLAILVLVQPYVFSSIRRDGHAPSSSFLRGFRI